VYSPLSKTFDCITVGKNDHYCLNTCQIFISSIQPQPSFVGEFVGFETFLEGVAQCKSLIEIVGLNAHDVSKAIRIFRSRFSMEANQPNNRQFKLLKLKNTQTLVIKLFQTMNEDDGQIGSFVSRRSPGHRKGFLSRLAEADNLPSLCIWLEAYSFDFNDKLNQLASDGVGCRDQSLHKNYQTTRKWFFDEGA